MRVLEAEDSIRPVAKIIASDPFHYMHQRYKEVTRILGRIPNALVRLVWIIWLSFASIR